MGTPGRRGATGGQLPVGSRCPAGPGGFPGGGGGTGGLLGSSEPSDELVPALTEDADSYTWIAATTGANSAAGYQLATG